MSGDLPIGCYWRVVALPLPVALFLTMRFSWDYEHLSRAGSLIVLFSAVLYHRQYRFQYPMERFTDLTYTTGNPMPIKRQRLQRIATWLVVIGTLIWGYGDLVFCYPYR